MIQTLPQFQAAEYAHLRAEYPDASPADCRELAYGPGRRQKWVEQTTAAMKVEVPTAAQWNSLLRDLGREYIARRVFHDAPDTPARYLAAGRMLHGNEKPWFVAA